MLQGWVLTEQGQVEKGVRQIQEGIVNLRLTKCEMIQHEV